MRFGFPTHPGVCCFSRRQRASRQAASLLAGSSGRSQRRPAARRDPVDMTNFDPMQFSTR